MGTVERFDQIMDTVKTRTVRPTDRAIETHQAYVYACVDGDVRLFYGESNIREATLRDADDRIAEILRSEADWQAKYVVNQQLSSAALAGDTLNTYPPREAGDFLGV